MSGGILDGVRVLDLAGPALTYAGRMFADLGADVILVEPPGGAPSRHHPPVVAVEGGGRVSAHFAFMAAGKRSVALDVDRDPGHELFERLAATADVVFLPDDVDERRARRLDTDRVRAVSDGVVVTTVSGFGATGPRRHWRGSDLVGWASSGAMSRMGDPDRPPVAPGGGLAETAGALNAALGTMLALRSERRSGRGDVVDISLQEAVMSVSMEAGPLYWLEGQVTQRTGALRMGAHGIFAAQDGNVDVVAFLPTQWDRMAEWLAEELGVEEVVSETFRGPTARFEFREVIEAWVSELTGRYTKQDFFLEGQRRHIPVGPVNNAADVLDDPQLAAVDGWVHVAHPDTGTVRVPRSPVRFDGTSTSAGAVPAPGEHSVDVLRTLVGLTDGEIDALVAEGVVATA